MAELVNPPAAGRSFGETERHAIHRDLQDAMQKLVGIFRNKEDLERSLGEIDKAKKRLARASVEGSRLCNPGWHLALDLRSMLTVSEAVALSALAPAKKAAARTAGSTFRDSTRRGKQRTILTSAIEKP